MPSYNAFVSERYDIEEVQRYVEACGAMVTRTLSAAGVIQFESSVETADAVRKLPTVCSVDLSRTLASLEENRGAFAVLDENRTEFPGLRGGNDLTDRK